MDSKLSFVILMCSAAACIMLQGSLAAPMAQEITAPIADRSVKLAEIVAAQRSRQGKKTVLNFVVENDEARKEYFQEREKALHVSKNGGNAGPLKKGDDRSKRQNPHVLPHLLSTPATPAVVTAPAPAPLPQAENTALSQSAADEIAAARASYRNGLEGSALAKALALSKAKPQTVDPSGSYSG